MDEKGGSSADHALHGHETAALLHNAVYTREPQSRALALLLRREERFEYLALRLGIHSMAGIGDRQNRMPLGTRPKRDRIVFIDHTVISCDPEFATIGHRIARVYAQVHQNQVELVAVGADPADFWIKTNGDANILAY